MEPQLQIEAPQVIRAASNPAKKWLLVSIAGFTVFFLALGFHFFYGASSSSYPLPKPILRQVFGFNPYYFAKDTPPDNLSLVPNSTKFIANSLQYDLISSSKKTISVSQGAATTTINTVKQDGETFETTIGTAKIKTASGRIKASLITADKTIITLEAPDQISSNTLAHIYNALIPVNKGASVSIH